MTSLRAESVNGKRLSMVTFTPMALFPSKRMLRASALMYVVSVDLAMASRKNVFSAELRSPVAGSIVACMFAYPSSFPLLRPGIRFRPRASNSLVAYAEKGLGNVERDTSRGPPSDENAFAS